ncbi:hypothetical protein [Flavivirga sp. 57AJ16]|uniref:hypothetical protein n=1 Tax=Flavivirga sp. 57AJ16 TaxID=3025307 RepID=UPI002366A7DA|nr:hypothetical protein [Flavivirga sp. 57AJ16]MDD7885745.1 hypothetical protein [Flavivirga sp. 57AJ16]
MELKDGIIVILLLLLFRNRDCFCEDKEEVIDDNGSTADEELPRNLDIEEVERRTDTNVNYN